MYHSMKSNNSRRTQLTTDPLMRASNRKVYTHSLAKEFEGPNRARKVMQLAVEILAPLMVFVFILFFTMFFFYSCPTCCWLIYFAILLSSISYFYIVDHCLKSHKWSKVIGNYCAIAVTIGFVGGLLIHYHYMLYYYKYKMMMRYSNVAASQDVLQFEDAGWLLFTEGTKVDTTRAVGYRNLRTATTLCAAPIIDGQMATSDPIVFWAVGENCCNWRASFNCDDAEAGGRNGLLVLEPHNLVSDSMAWTVRDQFDKSGFEEAIKLGESVFAMSAGKDIRFVRWLNDPEKTVNGYRDKSVQLGLFGCLGYLVVAILYIIHSLGKEEMRQRQYIEKVTGADL